MPYNDGAMDIKGAMELARLLRERHGGAVPSEPNAFAEDDGRPPVFRWFGLQPPGDARVDDAVRRAELVGE